MIIIIMMMRIIMIQYTRSPLQDSRLFGPRPWKILAATYETNGFLSDPDPGESFVMGNLVTETGCTSRSYVHTCIYIYIYIYTYVCIYIYIQARFHSFPGLGRCFRTGDVAIEGPDGWSNIYIYIYIYIYIERERDI